MSPRPVHVSTFRYHLAALRARLPRWRPRPRHASRDLTAYDAETIAVFAAANAAGDHAESEPQSRFGNFGRCYETDECTMDPDCQLYGACTSVVELRDALNAAKRARPLEPLPERDQAIRHYAGAAFINIGLRDPYAYTPDPAMHGSPSAPAEATWEPRAQTHPALTLAGGRDETDGVLPVLGGAWEDPSAEPDVSSGGMVRGEIPRRADVCGLCGQEPLGYAGAYWTDASGRWDPTRPVVLCHHETRDCYVRWTVYGQRPEPASGHTLGDTRDYAWRVRAASAVPEWAAILATCDRADLARLIARDIDHCAALAGAA